MGLSLLKQTIRTRIKAARDAMPVVGRLEASRVITGRIVAMPEYRQATTVLGYMNFGSEYASELWVTEVLAEGKRLVLPKVNRHTNRLDLYLVTDLKNQLAEGLWGIREPILERCERLNDINEVEFALLPGIAFSRNGARLGYGGGFYDKLLAYSGGKPHRPALACAAFGLQIVAQIPQDATDVSVGWIVTEAETIDCSATGKP